jgi:curved DNA-binding protein CbpA
MDAFRVLGFPRELDLDPEVVRARFQELSLARHPDRGGNTDDYRELVEAAAILGNHARRWRHRAELDGWERDGKIVEMDESIAGEFNRVGDLLARTREATDAKSAATSALAKAMAERKSMLLLGELSAKISEIAGRERTILARANEELSPAETGGLSVQLACLARWTTELREAVASLAG